MGPACQPPEEPRPSSIYRPKGNRLASSWEGLEVCQPGPVAVLELGAKQGNFKNLLKVHSDMGWDLLLNDRREIQRGEDTLHLIGVENWGKGGFKKAGDFDKASEGVNASDFKILLSHDPSYWDEVIKTHEKNVQLTLSGHTHGMQFGIEIPGWFKWSPVQYRYDQWAGIYENAKRYINVNRGFGYLAYPGRVGIWPEITVIKLKRSSPSHV